MWPRSWPPWKRHSPAGGLDLPHPWFFSTAVNYRSKLEALAHHPAGDVGDWLETFAQTYLTSLAERERKGIIREVMEALSPVLYEGQGSGRRTMCGCGSRPGTEPVSRDLPTPHGPWCLDRADHSSCDGLRRFSR